MTIGVDGAECRASRSLVPWADRGRAPHEVGRLSALARLRRVIASVPRGKVITYRQVAVAGGFPNAPRLTVRALQTGEGLPWHRVVAAGGRIALPREAGREQRLRLEIEGVTFRAGRVRMDLHNWVPRSRPRRRTRRPDLGPPRTRNPRRADPADPRRGARKVRRRAEGRPR
ncbi:MAG: MGMT family protein [Thermoplasmata archaeon]|nr:MGMT family protein [Thermoplasmata archaeon]